MNSMELFAAIKSLKPEAQFSFTDEDYSTIKWDVLDGEPPTLKEIAAAGVQIKIDEQSKAEAAATQKAALLARLGITADEAKLLIG